MTRIYVSACVDETIKITTGSDLLSHLVYLGDELALRLPLDMEKRKETLLWLATQLDLEAQKL